MTRILTGAQLERPPGQKYLETLRFAELALTGPRPKTATLARWREELPADFVLSFVCPPAAWKSEKGALRFDEDMEGAFAWTVEAAQALRADLVVLPTGGAVTTGQRDRDLLAAWVERFRLPEGSKIAWHPTGLWDRELAIPYARKLGAILAMDPLAIEPPRGEPTYARLRALGIRSRFTETLLLEVLEALVEAECPEAWVAIESPKSFREASRLAELVEAVSR